MAWLHILLSPFKFYFVSNQKYIYLPSNTKKKVIFFLPLATVLPFEDVSFLMSWNQNRVSEIPVVTSGILSSQTQQEPILRVMPGHAPSAEQIL